MFKLLFNADLFQVAYVQNELGWKCASFQVSGAARNVLKGKDRADARL
jgi:hypothetical protein